MITFFIQFLIYTAGLLALAIPAFWVARKLNRRSTIRNLLQWGAITGAIMALIRVTSDELVNQCTEAGNTQCFDSGSSGMLLMAGAAYVFISWGRAYALRPRRPSK